MDRSYVGESKQGALIGRGSSVLVLGSEVSGKNDCIVILCRPPNTYERDISRSQGIFLFDSGNFLRADTNIKRSVSRSFTQLAFVYARLCNFVAGVFESLLMDMLNFLLFRIFLHSFDLRIYGWSVLRFSSPLVACWVDKWKES